MKPEQIKEKLEEILHRDPEKKLYHNLEQAYKDGVLRKIEASDVETGGETTKDIESMLRNINTQIKQYLNNIVEDGEKKLGESLSIIEKICSALTNDLYEPQEVRDSVRRLNILNI